MKQSPVADLGRTLSASDARQGKPGLGVRYVLIASMFGAAILMGLVYLVFFNT